MTLPLASGNAQNAQDTSSRPRGGRAPGDYRGGMGPTAAPLGIVDRRGQANRRRQQSPGVGRIHRTMVRAVPGHGGRGLQPAGRRQGHRSQLRPRADQRRLRPPDGQTIRHHRPAHHGHPGGDAAGRGAGLDAGPHGGGRLPDAIEPHGPGHETTAFGAGRPHCRRAAAGCSGRTGCVAAAHGPRPLGPGRLLSGSTGGEAGLDPRRRPLGAIHEGRTYLFVGPDQQRRFFADPDRYAPVHGGNDVVLAVEKKQVVAGRRQHGVYYVGRVYLFRDEASLAKFTKNPRYYVEQSAAAASGPLTAQQARRDWRLRRGGPGGRPGAARLRGRD